MYELSVQGNFSAAHNLRGYKGDCERLHGHNWRVHVHLAADELDGLGMVMDFRDVKGLLNEILSELDHSYLNEVKPFDVQNPTTENLCCHIAERLAKGLPDRVAVQRVTCWESENCGSSYVPPASGGDPQAQA